MSICKMLTGTALVVGLLVTASSAQAGYSYGGVKFFGPAYTFQGHSGQYGNVVFFGAPPTTLPSHNGQYGNVTFLGGAQPYTFPGHTGQLGNATWFGYHAPGTVAVHTMPVRNIVPVPGTVPAPTVQRPSPWSSLRNAFHRP